MATIHQICSCCGIIPYIPDPHSFVKTSRSNELTIGRPCYRSHTVMVTMIGIKSTTYGDGKTRLSRSRAIVCRRTRGDEDDNTAHDEEKNAWVPARVVHYSFLKR